jgi:hypothetical protein
MFEPRYHGEVRDPDTTPSQDLATELNLHLAGLIGAGCFAPRLRMSALAAALVLQAPKTARRAIFPGIQHPTPLPPTDRSSCGVVAALETADRRKRCTWGAPPLVAKTPPKGAWCEAQHRQPE